MADSKPEYKMSYDEIKTIIQRQIHKLNNEARNHYEEGRFDKALKCNNLVTELVKLTSDLRFNFVIRSNVESTTVFKDEG